MGFKNFKNTGHNLSKSHVKFSGKIDLLVDNIPENGSVDVMHKSSKDIPLRGKKRSLSPKGLFDSLIFYKDLTLEPGDFCFIWMVDGV